MADTGLFRAYLEAICSNYTESYVQTDAEITLRLHAQTSPEKNLQQGALHNRVAERAEKVERWPVLDGIYKYASDHVLLSGKPGSGKSTALRQLLCQEARRALRGVVSTIPVLVELRAGKPMMDAIQEVFRRQRLKLSHEQIDELLWDGQLLLLIDGVNEIVSDHLLLQLEEFRANNASTPMIFTTRDLGVRGDLGIRKKLEMQPLTPPQMREFVLAYLPVQGADLLKQLQDRLRDLCETPLLLKLLCDVFAETQQIPSNQGELFRRFDQDYARFKRIESISAELQRWKTELLQYLAFRMMQDTTGIRLQMDWTAAEVILEEWLQGRVDAPADKAKRWLEDLLEHHLLQVAADPMQIEFHHQLFQEYYAAEYLLRQLDKLDDLTLQKRYLNSLDWTESLALMLGILDNEAEALRVVKLALEVDLMLGARLAGEVKLPFQQQTIRWVIELDVPEWLKIELLGRTRSEQAVSYLAQALNHEATSVRGKAAKALGRIASPEALAVLIQVLSYDNWCVRENGVKALGQIASPQAVEILIYALTDENRNVQISAVDAIGQIASPQAVEALIQTLNSEDSSIRGKAAKTLGQIASPQAVEALIQALNNKNRYVQMSATEGLGQIASPQAVEALIQALTDKDSVVQWFAVNALGEIASPQAIPALIQALNNGESDVRSSAAEALGKIASPQIIPVLIQALNDEDSDVQSRAAWALGQIASPQAIPALIQALNDEDWPVRSSAAEALGKIASPQIIPVLIQALNDEDSDVQSRAAWALGQIASPQAIPALIQALNDEDSSVRRSAAEALGQIAAPQAVEALIPALNDEDSSVRWRAASALGQIASPQAIEALILALNHKDFPVQRSAAEALGKIGFPQAIEALIQSLNHKDFSIRTNAAKALSQIAAPQLLAQLAQLLAQLWQLCRSGNQEAFDAISAIQERCRFYNYEIEQMVLPANSATDRAASVINIYDGKFGDIVAGDKSVKIEGNYIEKQEN
ncbi:MAG: HEAT repeat domain-containing protein [Elainella sp. C42_A2020_010]|nr:HEAT repeat domain-containing protein [Elainella sp. C42_A2020_010]